MLYVQSSHSGHVTPTLTSSGIGNFRCGNNSLAVRQHSIEQCSNVPVIERIAPHRWSETERERERASRVENPNRRRNLQYSQHDINTLH